MALAVASVTPAFSQNPTAAATGYGVVVQNNLTLKSGEIDGGSAAGGNLILEGTTNVTGNTYNNAGSRPTTNSGNNFLALTIQGKVTYTSGGGVNVNGNGWVKLCDQTGSYFFSVNGSNTRITGQSGNSNADPKVNINTGQATNTLQQCSVFNFTTAFTAFNATSTTLGGCANNVTPAFDQGSSTPKLTLQSNTTNVWNLAMSGQNLGGYTNVTFNNAPTSTRPLVITVSTAGAITWNTWSMAGIGDAEGAFIIYNFPNATSLTMTGGNTIKGTVLAPKADIIKNTSGNIDGQVIGKSLVMNGGEIHYRPFNASTTCSTPTVCPCTSPNLVTNGSFGSGTTGWVLPGSGSNSTFTGQYAYNNGPSLVINNSDASGTYEVYQDITGVTVGKEYKINMRASTHTPYTSSNGKDHYVAYEFYNSSNVRIGNRVQQRVTQSVFSSNPTYGLYSFEATAPAGAVKLRIVGSAKNDALKLDEVVVTTCVTPPTVTVTNNGPLSCTKSSVTITATPTPSSGVTYSWTVPSGVTNPGNVASFSTTKVGTYTVVVTVPGTGASCTATATTEVTENKTPPTVTVTNNGPLTCTKTSVTISATPATGASYVWTVPPGVTNPGNVASFSASVVGTYSVVVTSTANGCSANGSTSVIENKTPPTVTVTNNGPLSCAKTSVTISATPATGASYVWTVPQGVTNPGNVASFSASVVGTYSVVVTSTANGCSANGSTSVTGSTTPPTVAVTNNGPLTCTKTSVTISATPATGASYVWTVPQGVTNPGNVASFSASVAGTYSVVVTSTANGCSANGSTSVTGSTAAPTVSLNTITLTCASPSQTLTATPGNLNGGTASYVWTVPQGVTNPGNVASFAVTVAGAYSVEVTNSANGCKASASKEVTENKTPPTVTVTNNGPLSCAKTSVTISATPATGASYVWTVPQGVTNPGNVASFSASVAGTYSVVVTSTANGCSATGSTSVTGSTTPPTVTVTNNGPLTCAKTSVTISATPATGASYVWTVPQGVTNPGNVASFSASVAGTYSVVVTSTANGCTANGSTTVTGSTATPTVSLNTITLTCASPSQTLTATAGNLSGGTASYVWTVPQGVTNPGNVASFTVTVAGNYSVEVTNSANGCKASASKEVTENKTPPTVTVTNNGPLTCTKTSVTISATPATGASYVWTVPQGVTNPGNVASFSASVAGTYSVVVTSTANGCTANGSTTVTGSTAAPTVSLNTISLTCASPSQTLTATAGNLSGGTASYVWTVPQGVTNPGNVASFAVTVAGTYSVEVTNSANGCKASASKEVTANKTPPTVSLNTITLTCASPSQTLTATPGNLNGGTASYVWTVPQGVTNPGNVASFAVTVAGTYSVEVTNSANGCKASASKEVTGSTAAPTVSLNTISLTCASPSQTLTATAGNLGGGTASYVWTVPQGVTNPGNVTSFAVTVAGNYSVEVTNSANGCKASASKEVTENKTPPTVAVTNNGPLTCTKTSVTISATPATGASYVWTVPQGVTNPGNVASFSASVAGTYSVVVTSTANGCTANGSTSVTGSTTPPTVAVTNNGPLTCAKTSVTISATPATGASYVWTVPQGVTNPGNVASFSASVAGTYSVVVTSTANGCSANGSTSVTGSTAAPTVSLNTISLTCASPSQTLTATPGNLGGGTASYVWTVPQGVTNPGNVASFAVTVAGTYSVEVTNSANGCKASASKEVTENKTPPTVAVTNNGPLTCAKTSVTISATPATGASYVWTVPPGVTNPGNVASFSASVAGTYSVVVTSTANGCSANGSTSVTGSTSTPTVSLNTITLTCASPSQTLTATVGGLDGGTASYVWTVPQGVTNPGNVASFAVTVAGTYSVEVTNSANGCKASASKLVEENKTPPTVSLNTITLTCASPSQTLTATPGNLNGGTASYVWTVPGGVTNPGNVASFAVTVAGTYSVEVTNSANGCKATASKEVTENKTPTTVSLNTITLTCASPSQTLTATVGGLDGGTASYVWTVPQGVTNPGNVASFAVTVAGNYSVEVTNSANGCKASASKEVTGSTAAPTVSLNTITLTCASPSQTLTASAGNLGGGTASYVWTVPGGVTNPGNVASFAVTVAGTYSVEVTNSANGCKASASKEVTGSTTTPTVSLNTITLTCASPSQTLTASVNNLGGGTASYVWTVPGGVTNPGNVASFAVTVAGNYSVEVTNSANGCKASASKEVTENKTPPTVAVTNNGPLTCAKTSVTISATPATGASYVWTVPDGVTNPGNVASFSASVVGTYSVVVTSTGNGCSANGSTSVTGSTTPPVVTVTNDGPLTCTKTSVTISATPATGASYVWTVPQGVTNPGNVASFSASVVGTYSVVVTSTGNGCSANGSTSVTGSTATPTVSLNPITLTCASPSQTLTASVENLGGGTASYVWTVPGGVTNPGNVASFAVTVAGNYSVEVTNSANGCKASASKEVTGSTATPTVSLNPITLTCASPSQTLTASVNNLGGGTASYVWTVPQGVTNPGNVASFTVTVAGNYSVEVTNSVNGCKASASKEVTQDKAAPTVAVNGGVLTCIATSLTLTPTTNPANGLTYLWSGPGVPANTTTPTYVANAVGTYTVTVTNPANGCTASDTAIVSENKTAPQVTATGGRITCSTSSVKFSVTLVPAGAGYSYAWSGPNAYVSTEKEPSVGEAGIYTLVVTNLANGCTASDTAEVKKDTDLPGATAIGDTITCEQTTVTLKGSSQASGVTYAWTGPNSFTSNLQNPTVSTPGVYTLTVSKAGSDCQSMATAEVSIDTLKPAVSLNTIKLTCANPSQTLTATVGSLNGGTASYVWTVPQGVTNPGNVASFTVTVAGTYSVEVTNLTSGCKKSASTMVTEDKEVPTVTVINDGPLTCTKTSVTISATPVTGASYVWTVPQGVTNPGNVASFSASVVGTYSVVVTSTGNGCSATGSTSVTENGTLPTVTLNAIELTCTTTSQTLTATVENLGGGTASYVWTVPGGVTNPGNVASFTVTVGGTYSVEVTNSATGCKASATTKVEEDKTPPVVTVTNNGPLSCAKTSVTISATPATGASYVWTVPDGVTNPGNVASFSASVVGTYSVVVTSTANGCSANGSTSVTGSTTPPVVTVTNDGPLTCTKTSVTISATPVTGASYVWTVPQGVTNPGNVASFSASMAGTYSVVVTSTGNGCSATGSTSVTENGTLPTVTLNAIELTCTTTSQTLTATVENLGGGTASYVWTVPGGVTNPGNVASFTVTVGGTYSVEVTNSATGCKASASTMVEEDKTPPTVSLNAITLTCIDPSQTLTATVGTLNGGTASYVWTVPQGVTNPGNVASFTVTTPGTYSVVVTNSANGCEKSGTSVVLEDKAVPVVVAKGGALTCTTSSIKLTATVTPDNNQYTYSWSGPNAFVSTEKEPVVSEAGTYTLTVTNPASGCTASDTALVTKDNELPGATAVGDTLTCAQITVTLKGSSQAEGVTYTWTGPGSFTSNLQNPQVSVPGTYTLTVTKPGSSCQSEATAEVSIDTLTPQVVINGGVLNCEQTTVTLTPTTTPAQGLTYLWSGPGVPANTTTPTYVATLAGTYTVTVTNPANGCTSSDTAVVTGDKEVPSVVATVENDGLLTCDASSLTITAVGTPTGVTYAWTGPESFTASTAEIEVAQAGTYIVTVTSATNGCTASDTVVVTQDNGKPTVVVDGGMLNCEQTTITLTPATTPAQGLTYLWSGPGVPANTTTPTYVATVAGTYTVTVTNPANGCTASDTAIVSGDKEVPSVVATVENDGLLTCDASSLTITAVGTPTGVTYAWTGPESFTASTAEIEVTQAGTYIVTVTSATNGCTASDTVVVTQDNGKPTVVVDGGMLSCAQTTVTLTPTTTPAQGLTYLWSGPGVPANTTTPTYVATEPGTYTVTVTNPANGCTASDTARVIFDENAAKPEAGADIPVVCVGIQPATTATLNAQPFAGATWIQVGNSPSVITIADANDPKTTISGLTVGTYTLVWQAGDCADTVQVLVPDCSLECVKPDAGADQTVCAPATTFKLPNAGENQEWVVGDGPSVATINATTGQVSGLTESGIYAFILRDMTIGGTCADTVFIFRGTNSAPDNQSTCNDTLTLVATAGGTWTAASGNPAAAAITAAGVVTGMTEVGVYKFILSNGTCTDTVAVERLDCTKEYDLALDKSISTKVAAQGDTITYTIRVWNEGEATTHGIEVTDTLNAGVQYLSYLASVGTYTAGTGIWKFDSLEVGDTVSLQIKVRVIAQGVWFNTAEITKMTEKDRDSTPDNGAEGEDDIDRECFTVPVELCLGQKYQASVDARYTDVVWFKDNVQIATGNSYIISETGQYTFTAAGTQCPAQGCCPIIVAVTECCPAEVCVPVTIKKTRSARK
ncbi:hypothetical protein GCM10027275_20170 [Rhabdobacter roseus]